MLDQLNKACKNTSIVNIDKPVVSKCTLCQLDVLLMLNHSISHTIYIPYDNIITNELEGVNEQNGIDKEKITSYIEKIETKNKQSIRRKQYVDRMLIGLKIIIFGIGLWLIHRCFANNPIRCKLALL
ncbi:hypothetical protein EKK58_03260 [Candidatus Dependentiae bacterium]|nr:MAG: hypothetical protein EKK58_03260 [Candidatus Dependentiae bacterium]